MLAAVATAEPERAKPAKAAAESVAPATRAPWVGLRISKLTPAMEAQLPGIPAGVGFLVDSVDEGGPADRAGLRAYDVIWKLDEQLLVNESQFATLLMMRRPGDQLALTRRRSGEDRAVSVELASSPTTDEEAELAPAEVPLVPTGVPGMPRTIVYPQSRTAETSREDGSVARLHYEDEGPVVSIHDAEGELVYEGPVFADGELAMPKDWACNVGALMRVMRHSEKSKWKPHWSRSEDKHRGDDDRDDRDQDDRKRGD